MLIPDVPVSELAALLDDLLLFLGVFGWVCDCVLLPEGGIVRGLPGSEADLGVDGPEIFATAEHHPGQPASMSYLLRMTGKSH